MCFGFPPSPRTLPPARELFRTSEFGSEPIHLSPAFARLGFVVAITIHFFNSASSSPSLLLDSSSDNNAGPSGLYPGRGQQLRQYRASVASSDAPPSPLTGFHLRDASTRQAAVASADQEPLLVCDDSSDPINDSDLSAAAAADKAVLPSRTNKKPLQLAETSFDAVILHDLGAVPILLLPVHCFYSLHEHIRERAPPYRGLTNMKTSSALLRISAFRPSALAVELRFVLFLSRKLSGCNSATYLSSGHMKTASFIHPSTSLRYHQLTPGAPAAP